MKSSKLILTFFLSGQKQSAFDLLPGTPRVLTLGSQAGGADVVLAHELVSRVHAQVVWDGAGNCQIVDSGSTNGTFVQGVRLVKGQMQVLTAGMTVALGNASAAKMVVSEHELTIVPDTPPIAPPQQASLSALLSRKPEITIGRQGDCDVVIDSPSVSRLHAKLRRIQDGRVFVIDLGSTNGTFLNGHRVQGNAEVHEGDQIIIGRTILSLDGGLRNLSGEVAIRTEAIQKRFKSGKMGLQSCSLSIPTGSLVAIMGPSGCGKSTLLKCLTGEAPPTAGKVYLQNLELIQNYAYLKTLIGYVPQDDIVHRELTVEQSLYYAAKLRMMKPTEAEIESKIADVLRRLQIEHIRSSLISKISGGQRKRVSIAVELLTDPLILFLDEPTSPLDPQTIDEFLKILQDLARRGTTVVMVTHKPEDLEYMDSVIFLAEGGAMVYDGSAKNYKDYFQVRTAVEVYANISGARAQDWIARYRSQHQQVAPASIVSQARQRERIGANGLQQALWLSLRYLRIKTSDPLNLAIMIGQAPIIALLVCLIFNEVSLSVPFMITLSAIWFGTSNAAREIVSEEAIYRRERMFNVQILPYVFSKLAVLSGFAGMQALLFSCIIALRYQGTSPEWTDLGGTIGWVWAITICATVMGLMISALVNTAEKAMTIVPLALIPQVMLAGVVARIENALVEWVSYLSPSRWGNEGLALIQGSVHAEIVAAADIGATTPVRTVLEGQYHDSTYQAVFGNASYSTSLDGIMLLLFSVGMLVAIVAAIRLKDSI